jgi:putative flippase GtrA
MTAHKRPVGNSVRHILLPLYVEWVPHSVVPICGVGTAFCCPYMWSGYRILLLLYVEWVPHSVAPICGVGTAFCCPYMWSGYRILLSLYVEWVPHSVAPICGVGTAFCCSYMWSGHRILLSLYVEWVPHSAVTAPCIKIKLFQRASSREHVCDRGRNGPRSLNFYTQLYGRGAEAFTLRQLYYWRNEPPIPVGEEGTRYSGRNDCKYPGVGFRSRPGRTIRIISSILPLLRTPWAVLEAITRSGSVTSGLPDDSVALGFLKVQSPYTPRVGLAMWPVSLLPTSLSCGDTAAYAVVCSREGYVVHVSLSSSRLAEYCMLL